MDELKNLDLVLYESESPDRQPIDFSISDGEDNVAWVWGDNHDVDFECNHPSECIEYGDDEAVGECILCGSHCMWHKVVVDDEGNIGREPYEWFPRRDVGGVLKKLVDEQRAK